MMSALRTRPLPSPPPPVRVPDLSELLRSTCDACQAGTSPKMAPVRSETSNVNPSTEASNWMVLMRGMLCGTVLINASVPHCGISSPSPPPSADKRRLSVSNCRIIRARLAPIAARKAISLPRADARARRRFATFALAISNTHPTAPNKIYKALRTSPIISSRNDLVATPKKLFESGYCFSSAAAIVAKSVCACSIVAPDFKRAMAWRL